jgi:hypothetical protein
MAESNEPGVRSVRRRRAAPDQVVVKLTPAARREPGRLLSIVRDAALCCTIKSDVDRFGMALIELQNGTDTKAVIDRLRQDEAVEFAEPNYLDSGS